MSNAMLTDLYAFTMAAAYVKEGRADRKVTCEMFTRRLPRNRRFMMAAGLHDILTALQDWTLTDADIAFLKGLPALQDIWDARVEERFRAIRFAGDVDAMPEGTVFFPDQPVLRVTAPVLEAQLIETFVLSVFNQAASVCSKAARVVLAAQGKRVLEFGMRRVHPGQSLASTRAAYVAGLYGTSNVAAAQRYGMPLSGTMAHAYVMVHDGEEAAFGAWAKAYPKNATLLVDTYDTLRGVQRALEQAGAALGAVRLDSGDLAALAKGSRAILDAAGRKDVKIIASGDLDEHKVAALQKAGAPIDIFAVGTELTASADAPTLGAVYKVVFDHVAGRGVAKFAASKSTLAGEHQVYRRFHDGRMAGDVIGLVDEPQDGATPLLVPVMRGGKPTGALATLDQSREHAASQLAQLPDVLRDLAPPGLEGYPVTASPAVKAATETARRAFAQA